MNMGYLVFAILMLPFTLMGQQNHQELWPNGKVKEEGNMVDGLKQGVWKSYYDDGTSFCEGKYKDDNKVGRW